MKKLDGVSLTAVLAVASALTACGQDDAAWRVCVDNQGRRVLDAQCPPQGFSNTGAHWYFVRGAAPAIGAAATGGSSQADSDVSYASAPDEGVTRGGFGSTADDAGSHASGDAGDGGAHGVGE